MSRFKALLRLIYIPIVLFYNRFKYFTLPNFFSKTELISKNNVYPEFQQLTLMTGLGVVKIGSGCTFGFKLGGFNYKGSIELQARTKASQIVIGDNLNTNNNIFICSSGKVEIGNNCLIGQGVVIMDFEAHGIHPNKRYEVGEIGFVEIGNNVWLGNNVTILKNTKIGENSIVAAGAIVSGVFPSNVIIGGIPAKVIKPIPS